MAQDDTKDLEDYELEKQEFEEYFDNNLQMEQWKIDPAAKRVWPDINKDSVFGNLTQSEMLAISMGEASFTGIVSLRIMIGHDKVAEYLFPDNLTDSILRKKFSILALSLSRDGFLRKLGQTRVVLKGSDVPGNEDKSMEFRPSAFNWLRKKKTANQQQM